METDVSEIQCLGGIGEINGGIHGWVRRDGKGESICGTARFSTEPTRSAPYIIRIIALQDDYATGSVCILQGDTKRGKVRIVIVLCSVDLSSRSIRFGTGRYEAEAHHHRHTAINKPRPNLAKILGGTFIVPLVPRPPCLCSCNRPNQLVSERKSTIRQYPGNAVTRVNSKSPAHHQPNFPLPNRMGLGAQLLHGEPAPRRLAVGPVRYRRGRRHSGHRRDGRLFPCPLMISPTKAAG